jgi:hypothetical protein
MEQTIEQKNKALVLEALDTLFNRKDFAAAEKFWSPNYIQHSAHIPPGRNGLFDLVRSAPATMKYENTAHRSRDRSRQFCAGSRLRPARRFRRALYRRAALFLRPLRARQRAAFNATRRWEELSLERARC